MTPTTLHCPTCGAAVSSDATQCQYCKTQLATVACPSCFGVAFVGSKFCPHCGKPLVVGKDVATGLKCPRCRTPEMLSTALNDAHVLECPECCGLWLSSATFEKICHDQQEQEAALEIDRPTVQRFVVDQHVKYLGCPQCAQLMNRLNFAHRSGVIIDVCTKDGIWFDRDGLRHIIEFIRTGGLERAREISMQEEMDKVRVMEGVENRIAPTSVFSEVHQGEISNALSVAGGWVAQFLSRR